MKRTVVLLIVSFVLTSIFTLPVSAAEMPQDGLVGWFKLDGNFKNSVNGEYGTLIGRNLTAKDDIVFERDPKWYRGLEGYSYKHNYGEGHVGFNTMISPANSDFTMGLWILDGRSGGTDFDYLIYCSPDSFKDYGGLLDDLSKFISVNSGDGGWVSTGPMIAYRENEDSAEVTYKYSTDGEYPTQGSVIAAWLHVVASCDYIESTDTYTVTLYQNGKNIGEYSGLPNPYTHGSEENYIYCCKYSWDIGHDMGFVDEVVIYDRALNDGEVAELYASYGPQKEEIDPYSWYDTYVGEGYEIEYVAPETGSYATAYLFTAVSAVVISFALSRRRGIR